ncbi:MAG TPA: phosphate ABC transporter substrate-binding protein PstS [Acidimicrobiia bacterium]|nr:phosphate ABC transporter substrate-binding protein PstS [Acidimicrobiia bacterium]
MKRTRLPALFLMLLAIGGLLVACGRADHSNDPAAQTSNGRTDETQLPAATLNASGSTFVQPFLEQVIAAFSAKHPGVTINYGGGGSGKGRTDLQTGVVDFAGSDGLVKPEDVSKYKGPFLYFPTVAAPITVSYHLDGVEDLQLSPATVAKIFQRQIKTWNAAEIKADNPAVKLPPTAITVVHRSDGSGTTEQFTKFLEAATPAWTLDSGSTVNWPADTQAGNGNSGVAQIVNGTNGAIGYVDFSDAKATNLKFAKVKNKAGNFVEATLAAASAALANITVNPDLTYSSVWADGADAYPITAPTWIIAYTNQTDKARGAALKAFLEYLYRDGQGMATSVNYAELPGSLKDKAVAQIDQLVIPN